jgi:H+/Cl- antiporter ClcA
VTTGDGPGTTSPVPQTHTAPADQAAALLTPGNLVRLALLGALIGTPAALVAFTFFSLVHFLEHALWTDLPAALGAAEAPWYLVIGLPVIGGLIVAAARILLPGDGGSSPLAGFSHAPTPVRHAPGVALAALGTLSFGLVLGPEAPVVALGSAVGVAVTNVVRVQSQHKGILSGAGSFAAISTLFGGPLIAGVMLTEASIGLGALLTLVLLPGFVAAAVGYLIFVGLTPLVNLPPPLTVPDLQPYPGVSLTDMAVAVAVGFGTALLIAAVHRGASAYGVFRERQFGPSRVGLVLVLVTGGLAVGLIAQVASMLGVSSQDVLFSGQVAIPAVVAVPTTAALLVLVVAKLLAYVITMASGFRGGGIFPAMFLGIGLATFPVLWLDTSPTLAVAIGAAAGMTSASRLVLTSMLFAALLVGSAGTNTIPAVVFATVAAYITIMTLDQRRAGGGQPSAPTTGTATETAEA